MKKLDKERLEELRLLLARINQARDAFDIVRSEAQDFIDEIKDEIESSSEDNEEWAAYWSMELDEVPDYASEIEDLPLEKP